MHFDLTWIIALRDFVEGVIAAFGGVGGIAVAHKIGLLKFLVRLVMELWKERTRLETDAEVVAKGLADVSPVISDAEQALKTEFDKLKEDHLLQGIYLEVSLGLQAFGVGVSQLSDEQKKALAFDVSNAIPGVTQQQVLDALSYVQSKATTKANSAVFVAANAYTKAQQTTQATA